MLHWEMSLTVIPTSRHSADPKLYWTDSNNHCIINGCNNSKTNSSSNSDNRHSSMICNGSSDILVFVQII